MNQQESVPLQDIFLAALLSRRHYMYMPKYTFLIASEHLMMGKKWLKFKSVKLLTDIYCLIGNCYIKFFSSAAMAVYMY